MLGSITLSKVTDKGFKNGRGQLVIKYFSRFIVLLVTLGVLYLGNLFDASLVHDHFLAKELILDAIDSPESLTYLGVVDDFNWLTIHQSRLSIYTPEDLGLMWLILSVAWTLWMLLTMMF